MRVRVGSSLGPQTGGRGPELLLQGSKNQSSLPCSPLPTRTKAGASFALKKIVSASFSAASTPILGKLSSPARGIYDHSKDITKGCAEVRHEEHQGKATLLTCGCKDYIRYRRPLELLRFIQCSLLFSSCVYSSVPVSRSCRSWLVGPPVSPQQHNKPLLRSQREHLLPFKKRMEYSNSYDS